MSVDDLLASAAGLIVIGGGANLQRLLREELLTLHIRLTDKAVFAATSSSDWMDSRMACYSAASSAWTSLNCACTSSMTNPACSSASGSPSSPASSSISLSGASSYISYFGASSYISCSGANTACSSNSGVLRGTQAAMRAAWISGVSILMRT